jgi:hypothetical protein
MAKDKPKASPKALKYTVAQLENRQNRLKHIGRYSKTLLVSWVALLFGTVGFTCYMVYITKQAYLLIPMQLSVAGLVAIGYRILLKKEQAMNALDLKEDYKLTCDEVEKIFNPIYAQEISSDTKGEGSSFDDYGSQDIYEPSYASDIPSQVEEELLNG